MTKEEYDRKLLFEVSSNSFCGFKMEQSWSLIFVLNKVLNDNPDIKRIVELGTGQGGLTIYFGLMMANIRGKVLTFDTKLPNQDWFRFITERRLPIDYRFESNFSQLAQDDVRNFIKDEKVLIFCDNGNKAREIRMYGSKLKSGDLIMAHDWGTEIREEHIKPNIIFEAIQDTGNLFDILDYYRQDMFDAFGTQVLSMRRK